MTHFVIISQPNCSYCKKAKELIAFKGDTYTELDIQEKWGLKDFLRASQLGTVPQIFMDGFLVGGYDELEFNYGYWSDEDDIEKANAWPNS